MAYLFKLKAGTYQVRWKEGSKVKSKTFRTRAEAKMLLKDIEGQPQLSAYLTFAEAVDLYGREITPTKKSFRSETFRLARFKNLDFAEKRLVDVTPGDIERYINHRMKDVSPTSKRPISEATVLKETTLMNSIFNYCIRNKFLSVNPYSKVSCKPKSGDHRERIASAEDIEKLRFCADWDGVTEPRTLPQLVVLAFEFACATGMRIGEILQIQADWINGNTIHLPKEITKTGFKRDVALSSEAKRLLALAENFGGYSRSYFSALDSQQRDALWRKIRDMADLGPKRDKNGLLLEEGLNFHDSRATFATWAASIDPVTNKPRLDVLALAKQTGHRDLAMLQRYYRANSSVIAGRLDAAIEHDNMVNKGKNKRK